MKRSLSALRTLVVMGALALAVGGVARAQCPHGSTASSGGTVDFGNVFVGGSTDKSITLVCPSGGGGCLAVTTANITGTNAGDFSIQSNTCNVPVAAGGSCVIVVRFTPGACGLRTATLNVAPAGGIANSCLQFSLRGYGLECTFGCAYTVISQAGSAFTNEAVQIMLRNLQIAEAITNRGITRCNADPNCTDPETKLTAAEKRERCARLRCVLLLAQCQEQVFTRPGAATTRLFGTRLRLVVECLLAKYGCTPTF